MNSRIYLQPDAVPTPAMIRTANRLFRHFGKEVTFLQGLEAPGKPDITMNRLRWALVQLDGEPVALDAAVKKSPNVVVDFAELDKAAQPLIDSFQTAFEAHQDPVNLVLIKKSEEVLVFTKAPQKGSASR